MKTHYHTAIESLLVEAVAIAVIFHMFRFAGLHMGSSSVGWVSKLGKSIGGAFTFAGSGT